MNPANPAPALHGVAPPAPPIGAKAASALAPHWENRPALSALTSLRFFAAMAVVLSHLGLGADGYPAVIYFFVLSGFVLTYSYVHAPDGRLRTSVFRFWLSRFARIAPAYYLSVAIVMPFLLYNIFVKSTVAPEQLLLTAGAMFTFLPGLFVPSAVAWNSPVWSLGVEACFYAVFPWLIAACFRWSLKVTFAAVLGVLCVLTAARIGLIWLIPHATYTLYVFPLFYLPHFTLGITAARLFLFEPNPARRGRTIVIMGSILAFAAATGFESVNSVYLDPVLVPAAAALIVLMAPSKLLGHNFLIVLGEASYAIFVLHAPLRFWWRQVERTKVFPVWLSDVLFLALVIATAVVAFYLIERPVRAYVLNLARRVP